MGANTVDDIPGFWIFYRVIQGKDSLFELIRKGKDEMIRVGAEGCVIVRETEDSRGGGMLFYGKVGFFAEAVLFHLIPCSFNVGAAVSAVAYNREQ